MEFNGVKYGYLQNLQGDIVGIIDSLGNEVVKYTYDAWGKPLSCTGTMAASLGKLNPFRYRGYVFDEETGLYYLRSRFYNSIWGRFINEDSLIGKVSQLFSHNVFCYCTNVFIRMVDKNGNTYVDSLSEYYQKIEEYYAEVLEGDYKFSSSFINAGLDRLGTPYSLCRCSTLIDSAAGQKTPSIGMSTMMRDTSVVCGQISENIGYEDLLPGTVLCKLATYEGNAYTGGVFDPKNIIAGDVTHGGIILDVYYKDNNKIIKVLQSTRSGPNGKNGVMITEFTEEKMKKLNWNTWLWRKNVIPDYLEWRVID